MLTDSHKQQCMALSLEHLQYYQAEGDNIFMTDCDGQCDVVSPLSTQGESCKHVKETPVLFPPQEVQVPAIYDEDHADRFL
jgi:hypothetical protein